MLHDPSQELVDTLKSEFENKIRGKTEETASPTKSEPVAPQAEVVSPAAKASEPTPPTDSVVNQSAEKQETNKAIKPVNEAIVEETPEEKFKRNCERYGYEGVLGKEPPGFYTLMDIKEKKPVPVNDPKTGEPFRYLFFIEPNDLFDYLDKEAEKKQAETAQASTPTGTPKPEVPAETQK
jgi:hypothetical protein